MLCMQAVVQLQPQQLRMHSASTKHGLLSSPSLPRLVARPHPRAWSLPVKFTALPKFVQDITANGLAASTWLNPSLWRCCHVEVEHPINSIFGGTVQRLRSQRICISLLCILLRKCVYGTGHSLYITCAHLFFFLLQLKLALQSHSISTVHDIALVKVCTCTGGGYWL